MNYSQTIGRLIGVSHHSFQRRLEESLRREHVPITADQFKMMSRLWQEDGVSQQEIAQKIGRNRAATGRMIDTLERNQLVERKAHPTDRRLKLIFLTPLGKEIRSKADECAQEVLELGIRNFTEDERSVLKKMLISLIDNLK